jgi:hypothetical protein
MELFSLAPRFYTPSPNDLLRYHTQSQAPHNLFSSCHNLLCRLMNESRLYANQSKVGKARAAGCNSGSGANVPLACKQLRVSLIPP